MRQGLQRLPPLVRERWQTRHRRLAALAEGLVDLPEEELQQAAEPLLQELERELLLCPRRKGPWSLNDVHRSLLGAAGWREAGADGPDV